MTPRDEGRTKDFLKTLENSSDAIAKTLSWNKESPSGENELTVEAEVDPTEWRAAPETIDYSRYDHLTSQTESDTRTTLGDYVIIRPIGKGGMGEVFLAEHALMQRKVAVKVLPSTRTRSSDALDRFRREVIALAKLNHPNIVSAYDAGEYEGSPFLVMEYVPGIDLAKLVRERGPMPVAIALDYVRQAAAGLDYAHQQHVLHRDVKPANLLVDVAGTVKILDLGLASLQSDALRETEAGNSDLTSAGSILGTPAFMAPEQADNVHRADERSDLYSLGCTLFYLLTGRAMFLEATTPDLLHAHQNKPVPSLQDFVPEISVQIERLYQKLVSKLPEDRFASATELITELDQLITPRRAGESVELRIPAFDRAKKPSGPPPAYTLFSIGAIVAATCFFPLVGAVLLAVNYFNLRQTKGALLCIALGLALTPFCGGSLLVALVAAMVLDELHGKDLSEHRQRGGKVYSTWLGAVLGGTVLAAFAGLFALQILGDYVQKPAQVILPGGHRVHYESGVSHDEAKSTGLILSSLGVFPEQGQGYVLVMEEDDALVVAWSLDNPENWNTPDVRQELKKIASALSANSDREGIRLRCLNLGPSADVTSP